MPYYHTHLTRWPSHSIGEPFPPSGPSRPSGDVATWGYCCCYCCCCPDPYTAPPPPPLCKLQALTNDDASEVVGRHAHELALKVGMQGEGREGLCLGQQAEKVVGSHATSKRHGTFYTSSCVLPSLPLPCVHSGRRHGTGGPRAEAGSAGCFGARSGGSAGGPRARAGSAGWYEALPLPPFVTSSPTLLVLPPQYLSTLTCCLPPFSALAALTVTFPSTPIRSGPSGSGPRGSGSPKILERGDGQATLAAFRAPLIATSDPSPLSPPHGHLPTALPSCLSLTCPPWSPRYPTCSPHHHPTYSLRVYVNPHPPHTHHSSMPNHDIHRQALLPSSMPNHVTGRPPWPHQCQHERRPQEGPGPIGSGSR